MTGPARLKSLLFLFVLDAIIFLSLTNAYAAQVTLSWSPNNESNIAGYKIYYGTCSRNYPNSTEVGNTTIHTISGLDEGTTYYFAATAYDSVEDTWQVYSDYAQFNPDGNSVTLTLVDGGIGDADATENGIIIDPSGIGISSGDAVSSAAGGGGGCFISSLKMLK